MRSAKRKAAGSDGATDGLVEGIQSVWGKVILDVSSKEPTGDWVGDLTVPGIVLHKSNSITNAAIAKARETAKAGRTVVCVLPADVGSKAFHDQLLTVGGQCGPISTKDHPLAGWGVIALIPQQGYRQDLILLRQPAGTCVVAFSRLIVEFKAPETKPATAEEVKP